MTTDPGAVVIVMSDHGSRPPGAPEDALLKNILAIRAPGQPDLLTSDLHPVDLLPAIFNEYFGTDLPRKVYRAWLNAPEHPLEMVEVRPAE